MGSIEEWIDFFTKAGITEANHAREYALKFVDGRIRKPVLKDFNHEILKELGISVVGDRLTILQYIEQIEKETKEATVVVGTSKDVNAVSKKEFEELQDHVMALRIKMGLINIGEAAADMLLPRKKPKSAPTSPQSKSPQSDSPRSGSSQSSPKTCRPPSPLNEKNRQMFEILRDQRDSLVHGMRNHRDGEESSSFLESEINAVLESETHLKKRQKLGSEYEKELKTLKKIKKDF